jgi:predicted dehydrogenase
MTGKVRLGLVGTSWWADLMYLPAIRSHEGAELVAVCGRDAERTAAFAERHGVPNAYSDHGEMFRAAGLDAVIVATPDDTHRAITLAALDAGLHVLCEKALALSPAEAGEMLERAEALKRTHLVLYTWRWQPVFVYLKWLLDDGFVGRPLRAQFSLSNGEAHRPAYQWRLDGDRSTGVLGDLGSHMIDLALWLVGDVAAVSAHTPTMIDRRGFDGRMPKPVNDTAHLTLEFRNGAQGIVDVTNLQRVADSVVRFGVIIDGDKGSLDCEFEPLGPRAGVRLRGAQDGDATIRVLKIPERFTAGLDPGDSLSVYSRHPVGTRLFIDAIADGLKPEPGFAQAVAVQRIIDAALRSHAERRWISL